MQSSGSMRIIALLLAALVAFSALHVEPVEAHAVGLAPAEATLHAADCTDYGAPGQSVAVEDGCVCFSCAPALLTDRTIVAPPHPAQRRLAREAAPLPDSPVYELQRPPQALVSLSL
jgi:hypothetical protein